MGKETGIAWCDHTFNAWWGCTKVSPACDHCYAETVDGRFSDESHWGADAPRRFFGDKHWHEPLRWNKAAKQARETWELTLGKQGKPRALVFCSSMADLLESRDDLDQWRERTWGLIRETPHLTWLLLTKRPQNIGRMVPADIVGAHNVWLGTTIESSQYLWRADKLIEHGAHAPVRFLSMEPLLDRTLLADHHTDHIDWVIVGSESGSGARPLDINHVRALRVQCDARSIPFFLKQADEGSEGISTDSHLSIAQRVAAEEAGTTPWRKRDMRVGPDGMKRAHYIIERPYLDGKQHLGFPEVKP